MAKFGIGSVWGEVTRTATHGFSAMGSVASALDATAKGVEKSAWLNSAKSAQELCTEMGIVNDDNSQLNPTEAIKATDNLLVMLRGY